MALTPGALRRRMSRTMWTVIGSVLLAYVFVVGSLVLYRHPMRLDFTAEEENTLSPETLNRLSLMKEEVRVILPVFVQKDNPLHLIQLRVLDRARNVLREYMARQPLLKLEAELNLADNVHAEQWKALCQRYNLSEGRRNCFIFITADGQLRQAVTPDDLAVYDKPVSAHESTPPQIREFRAERAFTAALTRLIQRDKKKVYAVEDHREASISDESPAGLSTFRRELEANGYEVKRLPLSGKLRVPDDCDLLLLAAPAAPFRREDREGVEEYLRGGGRMLVALGLAETGLEEVLDRWNIRVQTGRVLRRELLAPGVATFVDDFIVQDLTPGHPITEPFQGQRFGASFRGTRAMEFRDAEGLHGEHLLRTSHSPPPFLDRNGNGKKDEGEDPAQAAVAGAVWRPRPDRPPPDYHHLDTRIVALGAATPMTNDGFPQFSNRDFVLNSVGWLLGKEERLTVGSSAWIERRLKWDPRIDRFLFWVPIFLFPGIVLCFGGFIYFLRRS